jgi:hypothetical protein
MAETTIKIVSVFIGSPGGLETERQAAKRIVDQINQSHAEHWGCQIKLVGWEATLPGYARAQSLINQDLDKCDYFIGVVWNRWGSPPTVGGGKYTSGFEEEFERAKSRVEKGLMKDLILFFKEIPEVQLGDRGPSVDKVIKFREKCIKKRKPLFKQFKDSQEFDPQFRIILEQFCWREFKEIKALTKENEEPGRPIKSGNAKPETSGASEKLVGSASAKFLNALLERSNEWDDTKAYEAARIRLIALGINRTGNDKSYLGSHDANLLFLNRAKFDFDQREVNSLIDAGISGFRYQNVPLWYWISVQHAPNDVFWGVKHTAIFESGPQKTNAIRLLQCAGQKTPVFGEVFDRREILTRWIKEPNSDDEFLCALKFLKTNGEVDDLEILEEYIDEVPVQRKSAVAATIISLLATKDLFNAFDKLIKLDPDVLDRADVDALFSFSKSVPTATLERCLGLKADRVRKAAAGILGSRGAIDIPAAEKMLTDTDGEVRLIGIESLQQNGVEVSDETVRAALIPKPSFGLFGFGNPFAVPTDKGLYESYQRRRLFRLSYSELRKKVDTSGVIDYLELETLYTRYTKRCLPEIRSNLDDGFKTYFDHKLARLASLYPDEPKLVSDARSLEGHLRGRLRSKALEALCTCSGTAEDIAIVRKTLNTWEVDFSESVLLFIGRFGDWSDIRRILSLGSRGSQGAGLLALLSNEHCDVIASTLYAVGKSRLIDLLSIEVDIDIKRAIIRKLGKNDISSLTDSIIVEQLHNSDDQFRKALALKCTLSLSQKRVQVLLELYTLMNEQMYYNTIHWLDLGASMKSDIAKAVATFELTHP